MLLKKLRDTEIRYIFAALLRTQILCDCVIVLKCLYRIRYKIFSFMDRKIETQKSIDRYILQNT